MSKTYYHSTCNELTDLRAEPICVTPDDAASAEYLCGREGHQYVITLRAGLRIASERDVADLAEELHPGHPYNAPYEQIERLDGVREALEANYDGVEYEDSTPDNATRHTTVVLFDATDAIAGYYECEI